MGKECADCGNERVMVCPNCDTRTTVDMDASRVDQPAASGGEKSHMQVIDELRARIAELEAEVANLKESESMAWSSAKYDNDRATALETENKRLVEERDGWKREAEAWRTWAEWRHQSSDIGMSRGELHEFNKRKDAAMLDLHNAIAANDARAGGGGA